MAEAINQDELVKVFLTQFCLTLERSRGIPEANLLKQLLFMYGKSLVDKEPMPPLQKVNCFYAHPELAKFPGYEVFNELGINIATGIRESFRSRDNSPSWAEWYLNSWRFKREFIVNSGARYFFARDSIRNFARGEVTDVYSKSELEQISKIGEILAPYKDRIIAPPGY